MSVREEDQKKNSCPSRGLGLAAAAIGVGVGAALYYLFNKRPEHPDSAGSTSHNWSCEQDSTLNNSNLNMSDYTTISENTTSDTSIQESDTSLQQSDTSLQQSDTSLLQSDTSLLQSDTSLLQSDTSLQQSDTSIQESDTSITDSSTNYTDSNSNNRSDLDSNEPDLDSSHTGTERDSFINPLSDILEHYDSDDSLLDFHIELDVSGDWEVTDTIDVPEHVNITISPLQRLRRAFNGAAQETRKSSEEEQIAILRQEAFRERSWTLEECSICFEVMLKNEQLMRLPCSHNFHVQCIGPWLEEQSTCPNCRKPAE